MSDETRALDAEPAGMDFDTAREHLERATWGELPLVTVESEAANVVLGEVRRLGAALADQECEHRRECGEVHAELERAERDVERLRAELATQAAHMGELLARLPDA